jgi:transcriptional regulator with XRE-family HTH domain
MTLGDRLKSLRIGRRESLFQVADAVGSSKGYIWDLERNCSKNPSLDLLARLAGHFGTTVSYLIENQEGDPTQAKQFVRRNMRNIAALGRDDMRFVENLITRLSQRQPLIIETGESAGDGGDE